MFELALPSRAKQQSSERLCEVHYHRCCLLAGPLPTLCLDAYVCMPGTIFLDAGLFTPAQVCVLQGPFLLDAARSTCLSKVRPAPLSLDALARACTHAFWSCFPHETIARWPVSRPSRRRKTPNRPETEQTNDPKRNGSGAPFRAWN